MYSPTYANYLLTDATLWPDALNDLYRLEVPVKAVTLYTNTAFHALQLKGPILVELGAEQTLRDRWRYDIELRKKATLLQSQATFTELATSLKRFINPGGRGLVRFADPLTAYFWLVGHHQEVLDEVLPPIERWWIGKPAHHWEPQPAWQVVSAGTGSGRDLVEFSLYEDARLEAVQRWLWVENSYGFMRDYEPATAAQVTTAWLEQVFDSAVKFGLQTERHVAQWAVLHLGGRQPSFSSLELQVLPPAARVEKVFLEAINLKMELEKKHGR